MIAKRALPLDLNKTQFGPDGEVYIRRTEYAVVDYNHLFVRWVEPINDWKKERDQLKEGERLTSVWRLVPVDPQEK